MTSETLYSIRMRASKGERHISGAERLVVRDRIDATVGELIARALGRGCDPESITVNIESLGTEKPVKIKALDLVTVNVPDWRTGRAAAQRVLVMTGVSEQAVESAMLDLDRGAAPSGGNMRGAMIMDARTGKRLEPDQWRGVRASRFDWSDESGVSIDKALKQAGLTHFRTREALALATKVAHGAGVVAELCWSDEPDYTAGYVASLRSGYVRFPFLKQEGKDRGGRAFFVQSGDFDKKRLIQYMQSEAVLIDQIGTCRETKSVEDYLSGVVQR